MTNLSDFKRDALDNPAKMACPKATSTSQARRLSALGDGEPTPLGCNSYNLMRETGLLLLALLEREGVLAPGGFVGIDFDPTRIDGFRHRRLDLK